MKKEPIGETRRQNKLPGFNHCAVGKIWNQEVLARIGHLCRKHHVVVVSDEIHCDLTAPGRSYVPFASVSGEWLDALRSYIQENKVTAMKYIEANIPQARLVPSEATYPLWLDLNGMIGNSTEVVGFIRRKTGLYVSEGSQYGKGGEDFLRMNAACPRSTLMDGLARLRNGLEAYEEYRISRC